MERLRPEDLNWSLRRGSDAESTGATFASLSARIRGFITSVRASLTAGTGLQWSTVEDFSNMIQPEAARLIADTFLDPDVVKWFVQQESHIRDPQHYLDYLSNEAERLDEIHIRLTARRTSSTEKMVSPSSPKASAGIYPSNDVSRQMPALAVFISHSSQDAELAGQLVDLLRSALNLRSDAVRCTSVDGYRLPAGADSDEQLRDEALHSSVFIGVLSPFSMASAYVLFELGARWGAKKPIIPLLAPGIGPQVLRGPFVGLNAISCDSASQLHQLVEDVSRSLDVRPEGAAVYQRHVDAIIYSAHPPQTAPAETPTVTPPRISARPAIVAATEPGAAPLAHIDEYADADEVIARHCEREWPDDYSMRAYCVKQQKEAVARLKATADQDIPSAVLAQIRRKCAREWPDDYSMRHYSEQQQFAAYRQIKK